jgi:hypothetical protein
MLRAAKEFQKQLADVPYRSGDSDTDVQHVLKKVVDQIMLEESNKQVCW